MSDRSGDGLEQYTEPDSSDRPGDAIESGMRETVAHPGIDGTWHHYGNIEWWEPDQLYDSDYARPICPVKHCASGRDHECRTICTQINPDEELKPEFVETDKPVSSGWYCTHHGWFRIHNYPRETESESEQATLLADGGRVQDTEEVEQSHHEVSNKIAREIVDLADSLEDSGVDPYTVVTGLALAHDIKATEQNLPVAFGPISREVLEDDGGCDNG